jgi:hypothetical protein
MSGKQRLQLRSWRELKHDVLKEIIVNSGRRLKERHCSRSKEDRGKGNFLDKVGKI